MNPKQGIKSRYAHKIVNSSMYGTINVSGQSNTTQNVFDPYNINSGYVFAPYIMSGTIPLISESDLMREKQELRLKKLKRILDN